MDTLNNCIYKNYPCFQIQEWLLEIKGLSKGASMGKEFYNYIKFLYKKYFSTLVTVIIIYSILPLAILGIKRAI